VKSAINLRSLDSLRGLLAVYVLAGHARWLLWTGWETWRQTPHGVLATAIAAASAGLRYGHEAVIVFFVLSGFFIHFRSGENLAAGRAGRPFLVGDFFRRRAWRLLPPYVYALLLTVCLDSVGRQLYPPLYLGTTGDALLDTNVGRGGYTAASVVPALCLLPSSRERHFGSDGPLWSLAYEIVYYLMYPLWRLIRQRAGAAAAYGLGVALGVAGALAPGLAGSFAGNVLTQYPIWLAGAGLVEICLRTTWPGWSHSVAAALAVAGFVAAQWRSLPPGLVIACYVVASAAAVLFFVRLPVRFSDGGAGRLTEALGLCSYTIYICHFPMLALMCAASLHACARLRFSCVNVPS
jgi:peptidoglycan/LPS O-acetylase OafA/YrhL